MGNRRSQYSNTVLSPKMMEITRRIFLSRQNISCWLHLLGLSDGDSSSSDACHSIADICGGTGAISRWLLKSRNSLSSVVIDKDVPLMEYGRTLALTDDLHNRLYFIHSDAGSLPIGTDSVDCAFIHGALHLLQNGKAALSEMVRIAKRRVVVFYPDMKYVTPFHKREKRTRCDDQIEKLERRLFGLASTDYSSMPFPKGALRHEDIPSLLDKLGCRNIHVRGIMATIDLEELSSVQYEDLCRVETEEFINKATSAASSNTPALEMLARLYDSRKDCLLQLHSEGKRSYAWMGGPIIIWIGLKR